MIVSSLDTVDSVSSLPFWNTICLNEEMLASFARSGVTSLLRASDRVVAILMEEIS
jgi:hypothetical protein